MRPHRYPVRDDDFAGCSCCGVRNYTVNTKNSFWYFGVRMVSFSARVPNRALERLLPLSRLELFDASRLSLLDFRPRFSRFLRLLLYKND